MNEQMTFPNTWEEFEKSYGFTDKEQIYTNGSRLIQSFRVEQWLDHLPSAEPEIIRCEDCIYYHPSFCEIWSKFGTVQTEKNGFCYKAVRRKNVKRRHGIQASPGAERT